MSALVQVRDLGVRFDGGVDALSDVSFDLERGSSIALVGESGAGKTTLALCLAGLVQPPMARGSVVVDGVELLGASEDALRDVRWQVVALAMQGAPFNPSMTIGAQIAEPLRARLGADRRSASRRTVELAVEVALPLRLLDRFPHELSGGERRLSTLAMVLALDPAVVVLDEPTGGLDPELRATVIERIGALQRARRFALVLISHDLPEAERLCERVIVLYGGRSIEVGATSAVVGDPVHPYSWALVNSYPVMTTTRDLRPVRGLGPDPRALPSGCAFHPRCTQAVARCAEEVPVLADVEGRSVACHLGGLLTLLRAEHVGKAFGRGPSSVVALDDVSITVREGEAVGLVGPSGSGKTTLARIIAGHLEADAGAVTVTGGRSSVQLVAQDPWDALSPRLTVAQLVREPLDISREGSPSARDAEVSAALHTVGLPSTGAFLEARSHELSGGQLQRIALARALVARPKVLVADEPTAMLDASEQARLLVVLRERQAELGIGLVLVSHDLAVVRKVTDRIVVLDCGRVVEEGPSNLVSVAPTSCAGRRLLGAAPRFGPDDPDDPDVRTRSTHT